MAFGRGKSSFTGIKFAASDQPQVPRDHTLSTATKIQITSFRRKDITEKITPSYYEENVYDTEEEEADLSDSDDEDVGATDPLAKQQECIAKVNEVEHWLAKKVQQRKRVPVGDIFGVWQLYSGDFLSIMIANRPDNSEPDAQMLRICEVITLRLWKDENISFANSIEKRILEDDKAPLPAGTNIPGELFFDECNYVLRLLMKLLKFASIKRKPARIHRVEGDKSVKNPHVDIIFFGNGYLKLCAPGYLFNGGKKDRGVTFYGMPNKSWEEEQIGWEEDSSGWIYYAPSERSEFVPEGESDGSNV